MTHNCILMDQGQFKEVDTGECPCIDALRNKLVELSMGICVGLELHRVRPIHWHLKLDDFLTETACLSKRELLRFVCEFNLLPRCIHIADELSLVLDQQVASILALRVVHLDSEVSCLSCDKEVFAQSDIHLGKLL